jgi:hypothetical protein
VVVNPSTKYEVYMKHVVFTVVRCNPPTLGHLKVSQTVEQLAQKLDCDYKLFTTKTHDSKRNPLDIEDKTYFLSKLMPQYEFNVTVNPFSACRELAAMGYESATLVVGEDRNLDLIVQLHKYIGHHDPKHDIGLKEVEGFVIERSTTDYSSSATRAMVVEGNFEGFRKQVPSADLSIITKLYDTIRRNLG